RQGVGDDDLARAAGGQALDGRAGEHAVGGGDDDVGSAVGEQRLGGLRDRAAGVDHVVDEDAAAPGDLADDAVGGDLVGPGLVARLVDEGQRDAAHHVRP